MREQMFYKDLILLDLDVRNADAFFETMNGILLQKGFVGLFPCLLIAGVPLHPGQGKACLLQSFLNGYDVA